MGKRGVAESRMFKTSPFVVLYDSLEKQTMRWRIEIKILSENKYLLGINGGKKLEKELSFEKDLMKKVLISSLN